MLAFLTSARARSVAAVLTSAALLSVASVGSAQAPILTGLSGPQGFGSDCLSANDDGSSTSIDLTPAFPTGLRFFTETHTTAYVNTNGNITFSGPLSTFTPRAFPVAEQPMIAPYWADVDIREYGGEGPFGRTCTPSFGTGSGGCEDPETNGVWWHLEPGMMVITWYDVGYFSCRHDKKMTFQLILTAAEMSCGGGGDFDVEFRYSVCEWTTGDASGGEGGFGGTPGQAGFDAGNLADFVEIMGSRTEDVHTTLCTMSNVDEPGVWRFQIRRGTVICPEAGEPCDIAGAQGVCAEGATQCVADSVICQPIVDASDERCDSLDNDCDGMVDEGDNICGDELQVCQRGVCIDICFEGGCSEGLACSDDGLCVAEGCEDVTCEEGERCVGGECVDACFGIVCPGDQSCRAGQCLDLCGDLSCDDCTVCQDGSCVERCTFTGCGEGEHCLDDGRCIDADCVGVTCAGGEQCVDGTCVPQCDVAICPPGQVCRDSECVNPNAPGRTDAGLGTDAGVAVDGGPDTTDAGNVDAGFCPIGFDCTTGRDDDGCGCQVPGLAAPARTPAALLLSALLGAVLLVRRRRR